MSENFAKKLSITALTLMFYAGCAAPPVPNIAVNDSNGGVRNTNALPSPARSPTPVPESTIVGEPTPSMSPLPPDARGVQAAIDVVHEYYAAINAGNYRKAYELWSGKGKASKQTFEQFRDGFANTASVEIDTSGEPGDLEGAAGSQYVTIPLLIKAKTKDGKEQNFWGQYILRRSMVDGATAEQRQWRIYSAEIKQL